MGCACGLARPSRDSLNTRKPLVGCTYHFSMTRKDAVTVRRHWDKLKENAVYVGVITFTR